MITNERLHELVRYDPETGVMRWRGSGCVVGHKSHGYLAINIENYRTYVHRLVWQYVHGTPPPSNIDHVNGNKTDNRISNLRLCDQHQNGGNGKIRKNNRSGYKGVVRYHRDPNKWLAFICVHRKTKYLGIFQDQESAHQAYLEAARERFGEFARAG